MEALLIQGRTNMNALEIATENLDIFSKKLADALWAKAGIILHQSVYERVASSIPRHVDSPQRNEPLLTVKDRLQKALERETLYVDDGRCLSVAEALVPYVAVTSSDLD
jgi:hypothetical protein